MGTVDLHSLWSPQLKKLPSLRARHCVTSQMLVCTFAQVSAAAKGSVVAFALCRDLGSLPVVWLLDHDLESQEVRKPATAERDYGRVVREVQS